MSALASLLTMPNKRVRRTADEMNRLRYALYDLAEKYQPCTDRQLFYLMETGRLIPKTEAAYHGVVVRLLGQMRENGDLPWEWITDSTRWMRKPHTYSSLQAALDDSARTYRRDLWQNQNVYLELWCEKTTLLGILSEITDKWDVPLMITRGFSSKGFCYSAAQQIVAADKETFIYNVGDHDPSGLLAWQDVQNKIKRYLGKFEFAPRVHYQRIAVTLEQIRYYNLPTRPTKRLGNRHAKNFAGDSVEVEALPPDVLRGLVDMHIRLHVDQRALKVIQAAEKSERRALEMFSRNLSRKQRAHR